MAIIRATVRLANGSGLTEDETVNVWHFADTPGITTLAAATDISTFVATFYQNTILADFWGQSLPRTGLVHRVDVANVAPNFQGPSDDVVSKIIYSGSFQIVTAAASNMAPLPSEVAIAMSFAGDLDTYPEEVGSTRPRSRRRGRLFLGPWNSKVLEQQAGGYSAVWPQARDAILDAYALTIASINTVTGSPKHVVYSPTLGETTPVVEVSVDNAFDTIRSRGHRASVRETRAIIQT